MKLLHITIVIITHEMNVIQKICNKVAVMDYGQVVETGSVIQVFSDPRSDIARRFVGNLIRDVIPEPVSRKYPERDQKQPPSPH